MTRPRIGIVLAAGKGTRMKSALPKVLHPVLGKPMLQRVLEALLTAGLDRLMVVVGHESEQVQAAMDALDLGIPVQTVVQSPQKGTGHAVMQILPMLPPDTDANVLITCGDMPLVPAARYQALMSESTDAAMRLVTVHAADPAGYGRVIRVDGQFTRIVEEKDASLGERAVQWVNAGIYAGHWPAIAAQLSHLRDDNAQGEYYLTDVPGRIVTENPAGVAVVEWPDADEVMGVNSREQLVDAADLLSRWTARRLMADGVTVMSPCTQTLAPEVQIGQDSTLYPNCVLLGDIAVGQGCELGPSTTLRGQIRIGDRTRVVSSHLERVVTLGNDCYIGPFAHLRDNALVGNGVRLGNFVEVKESRLGDRAAAAHLCYLGEADVGKDVNMGAGSIIANYDPILDKKYRSTIADNVKIGCNSVLISPVTVNENASVAAGSVITDTVNPWDLAIARARQTNISQWVKRKRGIRPD